MNRLPLLSATLLFACKEPVDDTAAPHPVDRDHDGYTVETDCDDQDPNVHPGAVEACNDIDDDCDGYIDDDDLEVEGRLTWSLDADLDGWGTTDPHQIDVFCTPPDGGWVADDTDCDDGDPAVHPGADESCNDMDDNCNGETDEGSIGSSWYPDSDGDGYGIDSVTTTACNQPAGTAAIDGDCNDDNPSVNPGATEVCNEIDDDCDAEVDEGTAPDTWYLDNDADGYGTSNVTAVSCGQPSDFAAVAGDCNDEDSAVNPGASELCNLIDDDCDSTVDGPGMAAFVSNMGVWSDLSVTLAAGTATAAYAWEPGAGGSLYLCEGDYHLAINATKANLDVIGVDGSGLVSITGDGTRPVISATTTCTAMTLRGLTIQGGYGSNGGCIDAGTHGLDLVLYDLTISDCSASDNGGGLYQQGGTIAATDMAISSCDAGTYGGGLYLRDLSGSIITATIEANQSTYGAGLMVQDSELLVEDAVVIDNQAGDAGAGLYVTGSTLDLSASEVAGNSTASSSSGRETGGGGVFLNNSATLTCSGSGSFAFGIFQNTADLGGGVFIYDSGSVLISDLCDWGSASGDNTPDDVLLMVAKESYGSYGSDETFTCTASGCL